MKLLYCIGALAAMMPLMLGCEDSTGPDSDARVVVVNSTNAQFDVLTDGELSPSNSRINFAGGSQCLEVDPTNSGLSLRESSSLLSISTFPPALEPGERSTILIIPTSTANVYAFMELPNNNNPADDQSGLRVVNAVTGTTSYDVYVTEPGAPLTGARATAVGYGNASAFFNVPAGVPQQVRLTNAGTTTVAIDLGTQVFQEGQNLSLVVAMPASGSTTRRTFFVVHNC